MSATVVPISPYITKGRMDEQLSRLLSHAVMHGAHESIWLDIRELIELSRRMDESLKQLQRERTTQMFEASLELISTKEGR